MSEREDYADLDLRPPWFLRAIRRRAVPIGIVVVLIGAGILIALFVPRISDRHETIHRSISRASYVVVACRNYYLINPDRKYPATLADLQKPGDRGLLDHPDNDIIDAWGNPFRYALVPNADGVLEPHVWSERTRDGKTTLHGAKITADATVVRFGLPGK